MSFTSIHTRLSTNTVWNREAPVPLARSFPLRHSFERRPKTVGKARGKRGRRVENLAGNGWVSENADGWLSYPFKEYLSWVTRRRESWKGIEAEESRNEILPWKSTIESSSTYNSGRNCDRVLRLSCFRNEFRARNCARLWGAWAAQVDQARA